jgi:flagellar hook-length control protein FliK
METALLTATGFALDLTSVNGKSHGASPGSGISQDFAKLLTSLVDHMQTGAANDPGKTAALSDNQPKKKTAPAMDGLLNILLSLVQLLPEHLQDSLSSLLAGQTDSAAGQSGVAGNQVIDEIKAFLQSSPDAEQISRKFFSQLNDLVTQLPSQTGSDQSQPAGSQLTDQAHETAATAASAVTLEPLLQAGSGQTPDNLNPAGAVPTIETTSALKQLLSLVQGAAPDANSLPAMSAEKLIAWLDRLNQVISYQSPGAAFKAKDMPAGKPVEATPPVQPAANFGNFLTAQAPVPQDIAAQSTLPAQTVISTDKQSGNILGQIVDSAKLLMNNNGSSTMKIQLQPDFLGEVKLIVTVEHGVVNAQFLAQSHLTASLIQSHLPELKQTLSSNGISWQQLSVTQDSSQSRYGSGSPQSQPGSGSRYNGSGYTLPTELDETWTPANSYNDNGVFNYIV